MIYFLLYFIYGYMSVLVLSWLLFLECQRASVSAFTCWIAFFIGFVPVLQLINLIPFVPLFIFNRRKIIKWFFTPGVS